MVGQGCARAAPRIDQPLVAQPLQRVAHHGAGDLEFGSQRVLGGQAFIHAIGARFDGPQDPVKDRVRKAASDVETI